MSRFIWRIGSDTPLYTADDTTGAGAKITGGRWNNKGLAVLYCSESIALATLETFVHLSSSSLPMNRYLVRIEVPDAIWNQATTLTPTTLPVGWDSVETGKVSLDIGDAWLHQHSTLLLRIPSVVVPLEFNVLINPLHADAAQLQFTKLQKWVYDTRMVNKRKK